MQAPKNFNQFFIHSFQASNLSDEISDLSRQKLGLFIFLFYIFRGSYNERENKDIFVVDKVPDSNQLAKITNKKLKAGQPPKCFQILQPWTLVPDPISKRWVDFYKANFQFLHNILAAM